LLYSIPNCINPNRPVFREAIYGEISVKHNHRIPNVETLNQRSHGIIGVKVVAFITSGGNMATLSDLTTREIEILQLVLAGQTNRAIAANIRITEKTVEFHLTNIYTKIGMRTRMLAGLWAMQHGIEVETRGIPS
jgi:DNA-binding NarL/FixJ family response regulator